MVNQCGVQPYLMRVSPLEPTTAPLYRIFTKGQPLVLLVTCGGYLEALPYVLVHPRMTKVIQTLDSLPETVRTLKPITLRLWTAMALRD